VELTLTTSHRCLYLIGVGLILCLRTMPPAERYEPLPGLLGLPGFMLRKLSPGGRKIAAGLGVLLLAGTVAAVIVLAPRISESKRERAATEQLARERAVARLREQLIAEQRPRRGTVRVDGEAEGATRALIGPVERAITNDARARAAAGELDKAARRTACRPLARRGRQVLLRCTAVTSEVEATESTRGLVLGYSYRAAISPETGRFAFCKQAGRPALGLPDPSLRAIELPRVCGG
jgi:hypothetical protein